MAAAKRHHYIPKFLLRQFSAEPTVGNPRIWRLDKDTGRVSQNSITNEAVIGHFHRLEEVKGVDVEQELANIESLCKPAIEKAIAREPFANEDLELILLFSVLQQRRTPRSRQWSAELLEHMHRAVTEVEVATGSGVRDWLKAELGRDPTEDEVSAKRDELLLDLREGRIYAEAMGDHEILTMFEVAEPIARQLRASLSVACLHAVRSEFVLSDHPVCAFDPTAPSDRGVSWLSSMASEVTFPISRDACLYFRPGRPGFGHVDVSRDAVSDINLRSYATAEWSVYGSMQRRLDDMRTAARRQRAKVSWYSPHKPRFLLYEGQEGAARPHGVQVYEPKGKVVRGFRPKDRPSPRPVPTMPVTDRLLREWSHLVPDDTAE
jgi:hypothetical protein